MRVVLTQGSTQMPHDVIEQRFHYGFGLVVLFSYQLAAGQLTVF